MECTLCHCALDDRADAYFYICKNCGAYVKDNKYYLTASQEKERYEQHQNDVHDARYQQFTSPITEAVFAHQNPEQLGLDYGCGSGPVISYQLSSKDYQVVLYDPYFHPNPDYLQNRYDYILSCEVFEHFYQPDKEIRKLISLLKPGGRLYIMTHLYSDQYDFERWYYRNDPTHVFIYTEKTIHFIADKYQLAIDVLSERFIILSKPERSQNLDQ